MENGYSILMGIFAGLILIYAGLMALTKDYKMLPFRARVSVQPKDEKRYMKQLAKVVALVALAPALSALTGLWNMMAALIVLVVSAVVFIWLGTKIMRGVE
jgi:fatty acid desaturase